MRFFTDGSKLDGRFDEGAFRRELSISTKFRLPDCCSVLRVEVTG